MTDIKNIYLGNDIVKRIYLGTNLIWEYGWRTRQLIDYALSMGYTLPSKATLDVIDNLLIRTDFILNKLDLLYLFFGDGAANFKLINLVNPGVYNGTAFGGLTWNLSDVRGNGSNGYIDTGFNASLLVEGQKYQLNDASRGAVVYHNNESSTVYGAIDGLLWDNSDSFFGTASSSNRINSGAPIQEGNYLRNGTGLHFIARDSSSTIRLIRDDEEFIGTQSPSVLLNFNRGILGRHVNQQFSRLGLASYFLGAALSYEETQIFRTESNKGFTKLGLPAVA